MNFTFQQLNIYCCEEEGHDLVSYKKLFDLLQDQFIGMELLFFQSPCSTFRLDASHQATMLQTGKEWCQKEKCFSVDEDIIVGKQHKEIRFRRGQISTNWSPGQYECEVFLDHEFVEKNAFRHSG